MGGIDCVAAADVQSQARFFRVLGDPTRLRLIAALSQGERSVGELVTAVGSRQPRVSAHLACLRHCGFVQSRRLGNEVFYRLCLDGLQDLVTEARAIIGPLSERLASCRRVGPDWT